MACLLLLAAFQSTPAFRTADAKIRDWRYLVRGERPASDRIALLTIDDRTIEAYGRWPLPRGQYALLVGALEEAGARVVGFDLLFFDRLDAADDSTLVLLSGAFPNVVHSFVFPPRDSEFDARSFLAAEHAERLARAGLPDPGLPIWHAAEIALPFDDLFFSARALGHVVVLLDRDGPVRRFPLAVAYRDRVYPSLSLRMASLARGDSTLPRLEPAGAGILLTWPDGTRLRVPVDREGGTAIDFAGDTGSFPHQYSMLDVVQWYGAGRDSLLRAAFQDRIVLIGNTAVGEAAADIGTTPFSNNTPLVYVHANALDALLGGRFLQTVPLPVLLVLWAAIGILLGVLVMSRSLLHAAIGTIFVAVAWQLAAFLLLVLARIDMPSLVPTLYPFLVYATLGTFRLFFVERHAREQDRELRLARDIQQKLLPQEVPNLPELDVFGTNMPAMEVGGDYFDWIAADSGDLLVALGDVSGKGVAASLLMSHIRASLHVEARGGAGPATIAQQMHGSLYTAIERGRFATFFLARVSPARDEIVYCNAGHNPPLLVDGAGVEPLEATGLPLGLLDIDDYTEGRRPFRPGDALVVFSDGVTEAPNGKEMYGDDRLVDVVTEEVRRGGSAEEIGRAVLRDVMELAGRANDWDDVTVLVVRRR